MFETFQTCFFITNHFTLTTTKKIDKSEEEETVPHEGEIFSSAGHLYNFTSPQPPPPNGQVGPLENSLWKDKGNFSKAIHLFIFDIYLEKK